MTWGPPPFIRDERQSNAYESEYLKRLVLLATMILALLQYQIWFGQSGLFGQRRVGGEVCGPGARLGVLKQRNRILTAQVIELKRDPHALESRARHDLGMVRKGEVFFLIAPSRF